MKRFLFVLISITVVIVIVLKREDIRYSFFSPRSSNQVDSLTPTPISTNTPTSATQETVSEIIAEKLSIPWDIAFLPSGDLLVTERPGKVLKIGAQTKVVAEISGVKHIGEGGLLGIALHPNFSSNNYVYLYSTTQGSTGVANRVERYTLQGETLVDKKTILDGIKGSSNHDGGRILFGPDGYLYITTGDAEVQNSAQDKNSLNGKILRIKDDGSIPSDNPFGNAVYSLGHRNPQGLAWDTSGTLWQTEHGPSGLQTGYDEVNRIQKAGNYGWPQIKGDQKKEGYQAPIIQSGSSDTWAPAGLAYLDGALYFSGLRGEALYKATIQPDASVKLSVYLKGTFGRIRTVVVGPDGYLYITTSNTDGRGQKKENDDKIIRINPKKL